MAKYEFKKELRGLINFGDQIDTTAASTRIKDNIWFRGANVWILAFSVVIASVGLNINSTAVIIGAMLISPLMGPITGVGLALGTNDFSLLKDSGRNLLVMVVVSLLAAFVYFLISPLNLVNPTELLSRTRPTIFDVIIALFGGAAGMLENSRKERGTVLSGVAIATALMPPLCTAGYGIAKGNFQFFIGAMLLFLINTVFIVMATYLMCLYIRMPKVSFTSPAQAKRTRQIMTVVILAVIIPSVWSAVMVIKDNNFERSVQAFVDENKHNQHGYIFDYKVSLSPERTAEIYYAGTKLTDDELAVLKESAERLGIPFDRLKLREQTTVSDHDETNKLIQEIFERTESEVSNKDSRIRALEQELLELKGNSINYSAIAKELKVYYPEVKDIMIGKGAMVDDSLRVSDRASVIAYSSEPMDSSQVAQAQQWLRLRLNDSTAVVYNVVK